VFVLFAKRVKCKKEGRSYIGPFFHSSGTVGWIFMEFRFKSLLQKVAELFPVKYATRRYPAIEAIERSPMDRPPPYLFRAATLYPSLCFSIFPFSYPCIFCTKISVLITKWQHLNRRLRMVNISRGVAGRRKHWPEETKPRVSLLHYPCHLFPWHQYSYGHYAC